MKVKSLQGTAVRNHELISASAILSFLFLHGSSLADSASRRGSKRFALT